MAADSTAPPTGAEPEPHFVCDDVTCVGPHILDTAGGRKYAEKLGIKRGGAEPAPHRHHCRYGAAIGEGGGHSWKCSDPSCRLPAEASCPDRKDHPVMTEPDANLPPLTAASSGIEDSNGVPITCVGEDGDTLVALGQNGAHLPRERVLDAMKDSSLSMFVFDECGPFAEDLEELWAVTRPCDGKFCEGDCNWHIQWSTELNGIGPDTVGAFPVTVLEA